MPSFSWTQYHFLGSGTPLTVEQYAAARVASPIDRQNILARVRTQQWAAFREKHKAEMIMLYVFLAGIPLLTIPPVGGLMMFFTFIGAGSLWNSAHSHRKALNERCEYMRGQFEAAARSSSYAEYLRSVGNA